MSDGRDGSLEAQVDSVIKGLRAHDSSLLSEHFKASNASIQLVVLNALQVFAVDDDLARNVIRALALKSRNLCDEHVLVCSYGLSLNGFENGLVALSAADVDLRLHELYQPLQRDHAQPLP